MSLERFIQGYVARLEKIDAEIQLLNRDRSRIYHEARTHGICVKTLKSVVHGRHLRREGQRTDASLLALYEDALHGVPKKRR